MICARKNKEEIGLDEKALNLKQIYEQDYESADLLQEVYNEVNDQNKTQA